MPERSGGEENHNTFWVPFRERSGGNVHKLKYGNISWSPTFIPEGNNLLIDVEGVNRLMSFSQLSYPLEIWSYNEPGGNDLEYRGRFGSVGKTASAALEQVVMRSRTPLDAADFFYDLEANKGIIRINFNGIGNMLAENLPNGRKNDDYQQNYGLYVDKAFKSQFGKAINVNTALFMQANPIESEGEARGVVLGAFPLAGGALFGLLQLVLNAREYPTAFYDFAVGIGGFEAVYAANNIVRMAINRIAHIRGTDLYSSYENGLWDKLLHGPWDEKLQFLYPHNTFKLFALPYAINFAWRRPLIKGKPTNAS